MGNVPGWLSGKSSISNDNGENTKEHQPSLSQQEKEEIAKKRISYLEVKYPSRSPLDTSRRLKRTVDSKDVDAYIKDLRS
jgi:hypothetical protein